MDQSLKSGQHNEIDLHRALLDVDDILGRALCPYVVLGETARAMADDKQLSGDAIYIGVQKKHLTKSVMSTLKVYFKPEDFKNNGIDYEFNGVPIHIKYIGGTYKFLKNQDFKFYQAWQYSIPNPFEEYWRVRNLLR